MGVGSVMYMPAGIGRVDGLGQHTGSTGSPNTLRDLLPQDTKILRKKNEI